MYISRTSILNRFDLIQLVVSMQCDDAIQSDAAALKFQGAHAVVFREQLGAPSLADIVELNWIESSRQTEVTRISINIYSFFIYIYICLYT